MGVRIPTAVAQPFSLIPALVKGAAIDGKDGLHALHAHAREANTHVHPYKNKSITHRAR